MDYRAVLALLLISGLSPLSCKKRKEGEASCTTEFLEVNLKKFPENQYNIIPDRSDADKIIQAGEAVKLTFYGQPGSWAALVCCWNIRGRSS